MTVGVRRLGTVLLGTVLLAAVVGAGACGPPERPAAVVVAAPSAGPPPSSATWPGGGLDGGAAAARNGGQSPRESLSADATPAVTSPVAEVALAPVLPSAMAADLVSVGLDPAALPALDQLTPEQLRKVMGTFTRATGLACKQCHGTGSFTADTPQKRVSVHMWNEFVRAMTGSDGAPLYCDACHHGTTGLLARSDTARLRVAMDHEYVQKLKRRDGKAQACETCHGTPYRPRWLSDWRAK